MFMFGGGGRSAPDSARVFAALEPLERERERERERESGERDLKRASYGKK